MNKLILSSLVKICFCTTLVALTTISSCKKDNTIQGPEYGTVTDVDGNTYQTVKIGTQEWTTENLKTTHYNDGAGIPNVSSTNGNWQSLTTGAYTFYNDNTSYDTDYGKWYNWYAVNTGKLAPSGWHVATDDDYQTLINYIKTISSTGSATSRYVIANSTLWQSGNTCNDANLTGFTALPGGQVFGSNTGGAGGSNNMGVYAAFWTSTVYQTNYAKYFLANGGCISGISTNHWPDYIGLPVRCVKD